MISGLKDEWGAGVWGGGGGVLDLAKSANEFGDEPFDDSEIWEKLRLCSVKHWQTYLICLNEHLWVCKNSPENSH